MNEDTPDLTPGDQLAGTRRKKLLASAVAVIAVAGGGAAIAATQLDSPSAKSSRIVADAAGQLGVTPTKLTDALKTAYENEIAAELKAGQITQAKADALKAQIEAGNVPLAEVNAFTAPSAWSCCQKALLWWMLFSRGQMKAIKRYQYPAVIESRRASDTAQ